MQISTFFTKKKLILTQDQVSENEREKETAHVYLFIYLFKKKYAN